MHRRNFLHGLSAASLGAGALLAGGPAALGLRTAHAATLPGNILVVIFQRGGCDALNTIVPYGDEDYYDIRPTIAVPRPDSTEAYRALDLDGFFGLHPSLGPLMQWWDEGQLAVLPAVQYPNASRSHFEGQRQIESGGPGYGLQGWLNRYLVKSGSPQIFAGLGVGGLPHALQGTKTVSVLGNDVSFRFEVPAGESEPLRERLVEAYAPPETPDTERPNRGLVHAFGTKLLEDIDKLNSADLDAIPVAPEAQYMETGFGRSMRRLAQFLKLGDAEPDFAIKVATVSIGGWDTHSMEGGAEPTGQMASRLADLGQNLSAFYTDLGGLREKVFTMSQTEFGRTAAENGSYGTDHGHGSAWFALHPKVNSIVHMDKWPGLALDGPVGNALMHTVDFRDIYTEVLEQHLGIESASNVLPDVGDGYVPSPLGLFEST